MRERERKGGREEGRKGRRGEGRKRGREEGRKGGSEEGRKGGREEGSNILFDRWRTYFYVIAIMEWHGCIMWNPSEIG